MKIRFKVRNKEKTILFNLNTSFSQIDLFLKSIFSISIVKISYFQLISPPSLNYFFYWQIFIKPENKINLVLILMANHSPTKQKPRILNSM